MTHEHLWYPWQPNADQFDLVSPDEHGVYYHWKRECSIMGCHAYQYAEDLAIVGHSKIEGEYEHGKR